MRDLLSDTSMPRTDWSIGDMLAIELIGHLERKAPRRILEVGSGFSTAILAAYAAAHGAEVVTLEHEPEYHRLTSSGLTDLGLDGFVDLRLARLTEQHFGGNGPYRWYEASLQGDFDFVFVDGPPKAMGRQGVFFAVEGHLRPGWLMLLDDGLRRHEQRCLKLWEQHFPDRFACARLDFGAGNKGAFILTDATHQRRRPKAKALSRHFGASILSDDPDWWHRARSNVGEALMRSVHVVVGARNEEPVAPLPKYVDGRLSAEGPTSRRSLRKMLEELAARPEVRYVLYLDDRWSPCTLDDTWLSRALDILQERPEVEQVSLLHQIEVTQSGGRRPFAFAPCLLSAERTRKMLPSRGAEVRQRLLAASSEAEPATLPLRTVGLWPGVFRRTGKRHDGAASDRVGELEPSSPSGSGRDRMGARPSGNRPVEPGEEATRLAAAADTPSRAASVASLVTSASRAIVLELLVGLGLVLTLKGGPGEQSIAWRTIRSAAFRVMGKQV
jgi:hypothetical protein